MSLIPLLSLKYSSEFFDETTELEFVNELIVTPKLVLPTLLSDSRLLELSTISLGECLTLLLPELELFELPEELYLWLLMLLMLLFELSEVLGRKTSSQEGLTIIGMPCKLVRRK